MARRGITVRGRSARIGRLSTQAVRVAVRRTGTTTRARASTSTGTRAGVRRSSGSARVRVRSPGGSSVRTVAVTSRAVATAASSRALTTVRPTLLVRPVTSAVLRVPLRNTLARIVPRFRFQIPLITRQKPEEFTEDVLNVSETRVENNTFVPVERDGISIFRPEILTITDFHPIWRGFNPQKQKRLTGGFAPAGKLIDIQYNSLWLRRDTIVNLLQGIQSSRADNTRTVFRELRNNFHTEIERTRRTVRQYITFIRQVEKAKRSLDIRLIPRSAYTSGFLPLSDFFDSRMQINPREFEVYSDTKILMQLLFDFKSIMEDYSFSLLDLVDADREDDRSPVKIDRTYTLQDGFTFAISQLRSRSAPVNAAQRSFFNSFLNSLPGDPDDRVKLLTTVLSKEYRVSKGLGRNEVQRILQGTFTADTTGNPFDNIIGVVGDTIFNPPLGEQSLASSLIQRIDENSFVLPFEKKFVDSDDTRQTFVPGTTFYIDTVFDLNGNRFNTRPFINYVNEYSKKFIDAKKVIESLFELSGRETIISPKRMIDTVLASYRRSIAGTTTGTNLNRDQAIIAAVFSLANTDNTLKSLLFQYLLLVGLAQNTPDDRKPVFTQLANEFRTISAFPNVRTSRFSNPSLFLGVRTLRPFIARLALDIENRVFSLTTSTPRISSAITLQTRPDFNRFLVANTDRSVIRSAFDRLSIQPLRSGQTTVNVFRFNIRDVLLSNVDPRSSASTNFIKEFVDVANAFTKGASVNGEDVYLLDDATGRTRFNFISTSTQLLVLFEIFASMAAKYNFSKFGRSQTPFNTFITVDANSNDFVKDTIDDIVSIPRTTFSPITALATSFRNSFRPAVAYQPPTTFSPFSSPLQRAIRSARTTIVRSGNSSRSTSRTSLAGGFFSLLRPGTETTLVNRNIASPFLGRSITNRLGIIRINDLTFRLRTTRLRTSLISVRNKIIEERKIKLNILDILSTIEERLRRGAQEFQNGFSQQVLDTFLQENSITDLEITRTPAQVRLAKFLTDEITSKRISGITERRADEEDRVGTFSTGEEFGEDVARNLLIDEETVSPDTREALFALLSENIYLQPNLADLRTKIISVGIPAGFTRQLSDRVLQSAINETSFNEKQFDVVSVNVFKRDARFDDLVFKPQSFVFDLSLFEETDFRRAQVRRNERFDRILQRIAVRDYEDLSYYGYPKRRTFDDIVDDPKYDFLTNEQKRDIIRNHVTSGLLQTYTRLLTGLRIDETSFLNREVVPGTNFSEELQNLVFRYLREDLEKEVPNQSIPDLLENPDVDDETKDILRLFTYGNSVFEPAVIRNMITSPKMFDRVFHIAFNTEAFEVDIDLTNETQAGRAALAQSFVQERLVTVGDRTFLRAKSRNELAFEDYFVSIESDI